MNQSAIRISCKTLMFVADSQSNINRKQCLLVSVKDRVVNGRFNNPSETLHKAWRYISSWNCQKMNHSATLKTRFTNRQSWDPHNLRNSQSTPHHLLTLVDGNHPFIPDPPGYFACRRHDRIGFRETLLFRKLQGSPRIPIRSGHQWIVSPCTTLHLAPKKW